MPSLSTDAGAVVYDLVGLGFGPANLAIAGALVESWELPCNNGAPATKKVIFIEKHDRFRWHPGMLLPNARMQISFLKDLATLRSPQSPLTFLAYLHSQDRLLAFINRGSSTPTRKEYADYLSWAAKYVQDRGIGVSYGQEVIGIDEGPDDTILVRRRDVISQIETVVRARDLIISPGGYPKIPPAIASIPSNPFIIHSSTYVPSVVPLLEAAPRHTPIRIAVIGSGQSAAEVTLDLRERLRSIPSQGSSGHEVDMIIRKGSLKPSDDSPFANEIFDPSATDIWFSIPHQHIREDQLAEYRATNYGVVNCRTLEALYDVMYNQKVDIGISRRAFSGDSSEPRDPRITIRPYSTIISVDRLHVENRTTASPRMYNVVMQDNITRAIREHEYDAIICATGYQRSSWLSLFTSSSIGKYFGLDPHSSCVQLTSATANPRVQSSQNGKSTSSYEVAENNSSPSSGSVSSTPPTSPELLISRLPDVDRLYISRAYRLLPILSDDGLETFKPRIYLQGVEEATHGLSDTLLSVLGVRAGEVVADIKSRGQ